MSNKSVSFEQILLSSGGTNIANGINKAISCFDNLEDNSRQKYIILLSDGSDSSKSAQAALDAYALGIRIFALSIGNDSKQMQTVAANSNGIYLNSPTAEQINEMMQQFAAEVFDTAGKDVSFKMTVSKKANVDISAINPQPTEIIENEDGTKTLKWSYEKISIDENQKVTIPVSVNDLESGLFNIADNVSCTYFNRNGESSTVYADDIVMPVHSYKESGVWTAVYDSKTVDTVWKNIYWNGKLYDDGKIAVKACAGNDENAFGNWVDITNHADIENLSGRYVKLSVEMNVSSTGKTPELFDITVLSDGSDNVNYINNAPEAKIVGSDTTCVSKRLFLSSETADDAFCTQLDFKWSCDNENVIIGSPNKPYASFKFNESGEYAVTLTVSDGNSQTVVSKTITVLNDEVMVIPIIDIESPSVTKAGSVVSGRINNLNGAQISEYEIKVGDESVTADDDGNFTECSEPIEKINESEIRKYLDELLDLPEDSVPDKVIEKFVWKVTPMPDGTFVWFINLGDGETEKIPCTLTGRKSKAMLTVGDSERCRVTYFMADIFDKLMEIKVEKAGDACLLHRLLLQISRSSDRLVLSWNFSIKYDEVKAFRLLSGNRLRFDQWEDIAVEVRLCG